MKRQLVIFSDYHTYHGGELIVGGWVDDSPISLAGGFVNNQASLNLTAIRLGSITLTTDYHDHYDNRTEIIYSSSWAGSRGSGGYSGHLYVPYQGSTDIGSRTDH